MTIRTENDLRIGRRLSVTQPSDGALHIRVSEWVGAPWFAVPLVALCVPLAVWAAAAGHWIEFGGALVGCWFAGVALWLWSRGRRDFTLRRTDGGLDVSAVEGIGPLRRCVERTLRGVPRFELREPPPLADVPPTADPGADLVLIAGDETAHADPEHSAQSVQSVHIARLFGPAAASLHAASGRLGTLLGVALGSEPSAPAAASPASPR